MNTEVTAREAKEVTAQVTLSVKEYTMIQMALWTLKNEINEKMSKSESINDMNELYVYAQEIIDLKHDLYDAFNGHQKLEF